MFAQKNTISIFNKFFAPNMLLDDNFYGKITCSEITHLLTLVLLTSPPCLTWFHDWSRNVSIKTSHVDKTCSNVWILEIVLFYFDSGPGTTSPEQKVCVMRRNYNGVFTKDFCVNL